MEGLSLYDFDWTGGGAAPTVPPAEAPPAPEVPAPPPEAAAPTPPEPAPRRGRQPFVDPNDPDLPEAYRSYPGHKNVYKRTPATAGSIYDYDWGGADVAPAPKKDDHWAITRGAIGGYQGGKTAMEGVVDMASIYAMPKEQQAAAMLELGKAPLPPDEVRMQVQGVEDIHGFGDAMTWVGESAGQMAGSWAAAALYGGGAGAAAGGAGGAVAGSIIPGLGTMAGATTGAVGGFGYGTIGGFMGMGVGGMFQDLLHDEGVQKRLADGSVTPDEIHKWSMLGGTAIGALDAWPATKFGGKVMGKKAAQELVKKGIIKAMLHQAGEEGITEAIAGCDLGDRPGRCRRRHQPARTLAVGAQPGSGRRCRRRWTRGCRAVRREPPHRCRQRCQGSGSWPAFARRGRHQGNTAGWRRRSAHRPELRQGADRSYRTRCRRRGCRRRAI